MKPQRRIAWLVLMLMMVFGVIAGNVVARDHEQQVTFAQPILVVNTSFLNVRVGPGVQYAVLVTVTGGTELAVLGVASDGVWYQVATDGGPGWVNVEFTLPRGNFSNVPLVQFGAPEVTAPLGQGGGALPTTTTNTVVAGQFTGVIVEGDLRAQPNYNALIIRAALSRDPSTVYPLLGQTTDAAGVIWYLVNIPSIGTGWVDRAELRPLVCAGETVVETIRETPIRFDGISTRDSYLLPALTLMYVVGRDNPFLIIELADGTRGKVAETEVRPATGITYVCSSIPAAATVNLGQGGGSLPDDTTTTAPRTPTGNRVVVNTGNLNIRSGPGAGFSVVAVAPGGTVLSVIGRAGDGVWYLVEGDFGQGWLNNQFVLFRGVYGSVPVIPNAYENPNYIGSNLGQGGGSQPETGGTTVTTSVITTGRTVTGVQVEGDLRSEPSYDALIVRAALPKDPNTIYPLLGQVTDTSGVQWYRVYIPGIGNGWIDKVIFRPLACGSDQVGVLLSDQTLRFEGITNRQNFVLQAGMDFYIVGRENDFAIIELPDGTVGKVLATAVAARSSDVRSICEGFQVTTTVTNTTNANLGQGGGSLPAATSAQAISGNRVVVNTGNLNIRSGPNAAFGVVTTVAGGTELAVVGRSGDGVWYLVQGGFGQGWLNNQFVLFRGNYASVPVINFD